MTSEEIKSKLHSSKSADRRRAAKEIGKSKMIEFADNLYKAYLKERTDKRTWETQVAMILALGSVNYKEALKEIEPIIKANEPHDMITDAAAQTYVRLRESHSTMPHPCWNSCDLEGFQLLTVHSPHLATIGCCQTNSK